ncbi:MAG: bifunctional riboflavin kinase/FAD synthetase [Hyphomicrobiales bacterium]|nr:bifunctional riboflavin kinase/FAD synthetase [Hyphomicrobiales bacterium]
MRLLRRFSRIPGDLEGGAFAIGNFDGVHRGHQAVLDAARQSNKSPLGVLLFAPHPRRYFQPDKPLPCLTDLRAKLCLLERLGVDVAVVAPFDAQMASRSAERFVREVLFEQLRARHIAVGYDFAFGSKRQGNAQTLQQLAGQNGIAVDVVKPVSANAKPCSSTRIREALHLGDLADAADMLGYQWGMGGQVVHGDGRGRKLGFPTANIPLEDSALGEAFALPFGIYAAWVFIETTASSKAYPAALNIGWRPMFETRRPLLEAHLLDFDGDLYGQRLWVFPMAFLRGEEKFDNLDALRRQMSLDCLDARKRLEETGGPPRL